MTLALAFVIGAVRVQAPGSMPGYSAASADAERRAEAAAIAVPSPASAGEHAHALSREPHVSGTPAQARTRDYVIGQMKQWGLETEVRAYDVWMPHPTSVHVARLSPQPRELRLAEPPVMGDPTSRLPQYPTVNGYSGQGDATGDVVYVNYGLIEDYAQLDSMGVSVKGKIAIARYGRSFRGVKAREGEKHGAIALLIYSDPQDDGFVVGDVYPEGPMRPAQGVQRGSILNTPGGDPATPGWAAVRGARRLPLDSMDLPRIPVVPIGYGNATRLLEPLRGEGAPTGWQGGLAFRYHLGAGEVVARVALFAEPQNRSWKTITNTFGVLRGTDFPDELVIIGGHRDAWGPGAVDNVSGVVS